MKQRERIVVFGIIVAVLSLVALSGVATSAEPARGKPIKLGVLVDFTGPMAVVGPPVVDGVKLRLEQANYRVAGRPVELVVEDAATDASIAAEKVKKMVERDGVSFVIGPVLSGMRMAILPYLARQKVLGMSVHGEILDGVKFGNDIIYPYTVGISSLPVAQYASKDLGFKTATCIGADFDAGHGYIETLVAQFQSMGGGAVQKQWAPLGTMDWAPYLTNLKKADCVAVWTIDSDIVPFMQQYKSFGLTMPIVMPEANVLVSSIVKEKGEILKGIIGNISYHWGLDYPANKKFVADCMAKYKRLPEHHEAHGYADASVFLAALEKTKGDTSFDKLKKAIQELKMDTPQGPLSFDPNLVGRSNAHICDIQKVGGEWVWHTIKTVAQPRDPGY
ncbi:MAG: ABC transporter substrate-binding protein [Syntrophorhabdales bacterium]